MAEEQKYTTKVIDAINKGAEIAKDNSLSSFDVIFTILLMFFSPYFQFFQISGSYPTVACFLFLTMGSLRTF